MPSGALNAIDQAKPSPSPAFNVPGVSVSPTWISASVISFEISLPVSVSPACKASGSASSDISNAFASALASAFSS